MNHDTRGLPLVVPYRPRPIRFLELWQPANWRIQVYGMAYRGERPSDELVAAAQGVAERHLTSPEVPRVPAVVVDGQLARCCEAGGIDVPSLRAAGVGVSRQ